MKTLLLVRHAKSDWPENTEDFDRPLSEKGFEDADKMSKYLKDKIDIEKLVSSPALRAFTTCKIFDKEYNLGITTDIRLYNPPEKNFSSVIFDLEDSINSVAIFSHNNGISNFANSLSENLIHFPTCAVAVFQIDCDSWNDMESAGKKLLNFYEPKRIK